MPISQAEFQLIVDAVKEEKLKTATQVMTYINKHFVGTEMNRAHSQTREGIKSGAKPIVKSAEFIDSALRQSERKNGFKVRTEAESQMGDEARKLVRGKGKV